MTCPNCGHQNNPGAKFCEECGTTLASGCPNCGAQNNPGAKFCQDCGTPLTTAPAATARSAANVGTTTAESERKLVTVLFADLVGFTPFAEERDAEDVRDTLTRYFDLARQVVERYGGTVEKFIGDAVMAVWGAPTAHEDDAERAVRAALDLVEAVPGIGEGIQARAGVLTGEAAVTIGALNQGIVAGDLVNTASRLQSAAPPGSVLVGEATQRAAAAAIAFEPAGDQVLKGKQSPVPAWRAIRVVAERGGRNRNEALEAPFVGRTEEMRLLKDMFQATGREQRLRVVSVIGPGGIGKSRLAWEFLKYIDGLIDTVYWHSGRSPAYGEGITFWALGEMVRERCGLRESDDEETTRTKVSETVARWVKDPDESAWVERSLLTLLGVESGMAADQLFGAWRTFFERIAQEGSVVLVFEDMHFADTGLLDFIDHLLDWSRGLPIYVVTLARPDLIERRPAWGAGKRNFTSMYLEPLPDEKMRELLAGLVPGLPEKAVATIVARADGIPLYAVETVRTLVAEGRLVEEDGVYTPRGDLASLSVPETLTALIAARLDALDETERRIVHDAAVLGQSFSAAALAAVAGVEETELEARLGSLVRRELFQHLMDPRSPERGQYAFVQALIREVAYNTLSKKDRKRLHLAAARYFESLDNDEIAGALASHYLAAHANATDGPEADALAGQARIALKAAAARASSLGSFDQAATSLEQALEITTEPVEKVEILMLAADAGRTAGRGDQPVELLRRALALAAEIGDPLLSLRATTALGRALDEAYQGDDALALLEPAAQEFAGQDEAALTELLLTIALVQVHKGENHSALRLLETVLETAERRKMTSVIANGLLARGHALHALGRWRETFGVAAVVKDMATEHGLTETLLRVMGNLANAATEDDVADSLSRWRELLSLARRYGMRAAVIGGTANFGYSAFLGGEWDEGLHEMETLLAEDIPTSDRLFMLNNVLCIRAARGEDVDQGLVEMARLGESMSGRWRMFMADPSANAAMARGDLKAAHDSFLEIAESGQVEYFYRCARCVLWEGDVAAASKLLERYNTSGGFGRIVEARRITIEAGVAALEGRTAEARGLYREALGEWRATHCVWDEALTGLDMVELLGAGEPEVVDVVTSTRAILERLRAMPYLARLETAASAPPRASRPAMIAQRQEIAVSD